MGAWGVNILESDDALDWLHRFEAEPQLWPLPADLIELIQQTADGVGGQVLVLLWMAQGRPMPEELRALAREQIDYGLKDTELGRWLSREEREKQLLLFRRCVDQYPAAGVSKHDADMIFYTFTGRSLC